MKQELQRIKIAETCGWEKANHLGLGWWRHPVEKTACTTDDLPHYLNDLNAMHEAEKLIRQHREKRITYAHLLMNFAGDAYHATAAQRAEAFLRTLGLWEEGGDE